MNNNELGGIRNGRSKFPPSSAAGGTSGGFDNYYHPSSIPHPPCKICIESMVIWVLPLLIESMDINMSEMEKQFIDSPMSKPVTRVASFTNSLQDHYKIIQK
jgi:hypothetical protein